MKVIKAASSPLYTGKTLSSSDTSTVFAIHSERLRVRVVASMNLINHQMLSSALDSALSQPVLASLERAPLQELGVTSAFVSH